MASTTSIEWTRGADGSPGATWNPITGCSVVSPGCTNCYAMRLAGTRLRHHPSRAGLTTTSKAGPVWNGQVRFNEAWLDQPLRWRRPRMIFVCAHGDLFHPAVPDKWIDRVFAVIARFGVDWHTAQVLTKRSARMRAYLSNPDTPRRIFGSIVDGIAPDAPGCPAGPWPGDREANIDAMIATMWPLPALWLGVSAEDQQRANERVPDLLATPAAVRFVSAEPLLGPIRLDSLYVGREIIKPLAGVTWYPTPPDWPTQGITARHSPRLHWIIVGGESGPGARPMHPQWARDIRDQCAGAGVAFHFKQNGEWRHAPDRAHFKELIAEPWRRVASDIAGIRPAFMVREGKSRAGRLLDGVEHNGMPDRPAQTTTGGARG